MVESAVFLPSAAVGFRLRMIFARQAARLGGSAFHFRETRPLIVPLPTLFEGFTDEGGSLTWLREDSMQHIERQLVRGQIFTSTGASAWTSSPLLPRRCGLAKR